jgi:single-strand DNA-binding protein
MADSQVTLIGSLGRDPELRFTNGGKAVASSSLAVTRKWKQGDDWMEETSWFDLTVWGEPGEHFAQSCVKGSRVIAVGRIEIQKYEARDGGGERQKVVLVADEVGPSLRWATVQIDRVERQATNSGSGGHAPTPPAAPAGGYGDEEPF